MQIRISGILICLHDEIFRDPQGEEISDALFILCNTEI
jgi:hypothetical protein